MFANYNISLGFHILIFRNSYRDIPSAIKTLDIMKNAGIEPTSRTYAEILCAHAKRGDIESIKLTFNECREKNIQLADKEILDIIYTLATNQHLDIIDEVQTFSITQKDYFISF